MAQSKYFPNLENGVDNANVEQVEQAFSDIETDVNNILNTKQDTLTFDDIPTADSTNPVTSGGVKTALDAKADKYTSSFGFEGGRFTHTEGGGAAVGMNASSIGGGAAIGENAAAFNGGGAVGCGAVAGAGFSGGYNAKVSQYSSTGKHKDAIQLGTGTNNNEKTLQIYDYQLMDADGDIPTERLNNVRSIRPDVKNTIDTIAVNTIYDLGIQTALNITLPSGRTGDFIEFDFISGETATNLTVNSSSGLVGFDLIPGTNTVYTLYFDWGVTGHDGTYNTYGWRCNYSEYSITV